MCNPRRVRVRATRQLAESWEHEVRRTVTRSGAAVGEARVREPLGPSVGAPALAALESLLAADEDWVHQEQDDTYRHVLDGGVVIYRAATRELEIVATAESGVEVSAEAATAVGGELTGTIEADGEGMYYDDRWGGRTPETAERDARQEAQRALDAVRDERAARERELAEQRVGDSVTAEAEQRAAAALAEATAARSEQLRSDAATRLVAVGIQGRNVFNQALGGAYRDAILAYARRHGAESIRQTEDGSCVDIEFELQV